VGDGKSVWISIIPAVGLWLITQFGIMPILKRKVLNEEEVETRELEAAKVEAEGGKLGDGSAKAMPLADIEAANSSNPLNKASTWFKGKKENSKVLTALTENKVAKFLSYGSTYDCHAVVDETHKDYDADTVKVWANAEVFDIKTEKMFRYLQVFSACVMSFAHGANDVANSVGPFAAIYNIWSTESIPSKSKVPEWILVLGGGGIVCGLALYGYKIMRVIGVKAVKLSNSRGFCAELSTAITVIVASRYGLPVSTTQTIMGAVLTIGLFEGVRGVNWKVFYKTFLGWIATLLFAAFIAAGFASITMYAPQKTASNDLVSINAALGKDTLAMLSQINGTQGANSVLLKQINGTISAVFYKPPVVASETINTFNQVLGIYNSTFA
jgi:sodium-dependent phosphate transporter